MEQIKFVELKDVAVDARSIIAFGKITIPQTLQTPEAYAMSIWVADIKEAIVVTYEKLEERDAQFVLIQKTIAELDAIN
jgi:hypothetical protein